MSIPRLEQQRFSVGKYTILAQPIPHSAHMLRYTVFVGRKRVGSLASMPSEADCQYLENPPVVPPLRIFNVMSKPGRPKKGSRPSSPQEKGYTPGPTQEIPAGINIPVAASEDR